MGNQLQKWADVAMFKADPIRTGKPEVQLLSANNDPLGTIAATALMYEGKSVKSLSEITDEQRRYYLEQVQLNILEAPLEFVNFHFIISGVTRGFTHQMVRQRTATYAQESTRFAVKEDVPVGLPPSLQGTIPWTDYLNKCGLELYPLGPKPDTDEDSWRADVLRYARMSASQEQLWRRDWDEAVGDIGATYNALVNAGMPAEDARGLLPTNLLTRINYNTSLRGLKEHAGLRLCTQAQYEWRLVWAEMLSAIRTYGSQTYYTASSSDHCVDTSKSSFWQFDAIANIFKPICYARGKCMFMADLDRHCSIRDRVNTFVEHGIPSNQWGKKHEVHAGTGDYRTVKLLPITPAEWMLDPEAARVSG